MKGSADDLNRYNGILSFILEYNLLISIYADALKEALEVAGKRAEEQRSNPNVSPQTLNRKFPFKNPLGVTKDCIFAQLPNLNIWNMSPPDVLHDLAGKAVFYLCLCHYLTDCFCLGTEGVIPRLLDVILRHSIDMDKFPAANSRQRSSAKWKLTQLKDRIESFPLLHGNIAVSLGKTRPFLRFHGKAVQVIKV